MKKKKGDEVRQSEQTREGCRQFGEGCRQTGEIEKEGLFNSILNFLIQL
jgi:hypothetical protein